MAKFVKHVEWEYYWYFKPAEKVEFPSFEKLNSSSWAKGYKREIKTKIEVLENVPLDSETEPSIEQIKIFNYIFENQDEIISSIYDYHNDFLYPMFSKWMDIEEDEIVNSLSELGRVYGIEYVRIPKVEEGSGYFLIHFDFRYDDEHGLYILFKDGHPIDSYALGDENFDAIYIYENELKNENGEPLVFSLRDVDESSILEGSSFADKKIDYFLEKGTYRIYVTCNGRKYSMYFCAKNDLEGFTLDQITKMQ